ncbi:MAG: hypothetical protein WBP45_01755 [Daejeonella sp.]
MDINKKKSGILKIKLLLGKKDEATWTLKNTEAVVINGEPCDRSFSVPIDIIFKKVK